MKETPEKVIEDLKLSMRATAEYLAFLENIGRHAFRREIKLSDAELAEYIKNQTGNIMSMAREHLLAWKWINETGRLPLFDAYRAEINEALKATIKAEQQEEVDAIAGAQLREEWKGDKEPE